MLQSEGSGETRLEIITTEKRESSQYQEGSTNPIQDGCIFETERKVHTIKTARSRVQGLVELTGICPIFPLCVRGRDDFTLYWCVCVCVCVCIPRIPTRDCRTHSACQVLHPSSSGGCSIALPRSESTTSACDMYPPPASAQAAGPPQVHEIIHDLRSDVGSNHVTSCLRAMAP